MYQSDSVSGKAVTGSPTLTSEGSRWPASTLIMMLVRINMIFLIMMMVRMVRMMS